MKNRDLDYLSMVNVVDEVLKKYTAVWTGNEVAAGQIATIHAAHADLDDAQQNGAATSTGLTKEKTEAENKLIDAALKLCGFARSYALVQKDADLEAKVKLKKSYLEELRDEELEQRMLLLHKELMAIGAPLASYGGTRERLTAFATLVQRFTQLKPAAQLVITTRKGHNSTVPQLMAPLRTAFKVLDGVVPQWEDTYPDFVRDYQNARKVKDTGSRSEDKPVEDKKPNA